MEPFDGYQQLADSLDDNPAMIVSELRTRVQEDLAANSAAWILIGQALVKLGFQEQGEDSISYGEGLKPESEYSDPIIDGDPLGVSTADTAESDSQHNDLVEETETLLNDYIRRFFRNQRTYSRSYQFGHYTPRTNFNQSSNG